MLEEREAHFNESVARWQSNCQGVDEVLEDIARRYRGDIEKWREDTPSRVLVWNEGDTGYSVSMMLEEVDEQPPLTVYLAVWQDDEQNLQRASIQSPSEVLGTPINLEDFSTKVHGLIDTLYQQSSLFRDSPLPASVVITPLSPRR